jgi:anti-anti-sigma factor
MRIEKSMVGGVPMLQVVGDVDHFGGDLFQQAAREALDLNCARLLVNLEACPYLDSGGISVLIGILKKVKAQSGWVGIVGPCANVRRLLEITALTADPAFLIFPDAARAEENLLRAVGA